MSSPSGRDRGEVGLPKQQMQADGDEEPRQYGLCCDACRGEGEDTRGGWGVVTVQSHDFSVNCHE